MRGVTGEVWLQTCTVVSFQDNILLIFQHRRRGAIIEHVIAVLMIMSGLLTISSQFCHVSARSINVCLVTMSEQKRAAEAEPERGCIAKKRKVTVKTVQKWVQENDKALNTATWLTFDKLDRENVAMLKCSVCTKFEKKLQSTRNYNAAFIVCSANLRTSSFKDHQPQICINAPCCFIRRASPAMQPSTHQ